MMVRGGRCDRSSWRLTRRGVRPLALVAVALLLGMATVGPVAVAGVLPRPPRPPEQPADGPGGLAFRYAGVDAARVGEVPRGAWVFTPSTLELNGPPIAEPLPLVLFFHGFTAVDPRVYRDWIDHIVQRGAIVVYPDYHDLLPIGDDWRDYEENVVAGIDLALAALNEHGPAVDIDRVAVVGHSLGGVLAANYLATAGERDLPVPTILMAVQPGGCGGCEPIGENEGIALADLDWLEPELRALVVVSDDDSVVGDNAARELWRRLDAVPDDRRDYVTLRSDFHGLPYLRATHWLPQTDGIGAAVDALDWYGTWKLFDLQTDCAFDGRSCDVAMNGSAIQRSMGVWSDGEPVTEAEITDDPDE